MRVGVEGNHIPDAPKLGGFKTLEFAKEHGLGGVFFRSPLNLSPKLDEGELREAKAYADELGLYVELGVGRVNPYNTVESPEIYVLGEGDYARGIERLVRAARLIDCTELWAETATYKRHLPGYFKYDRFRTEAPWADQLQATQKFLHMLAPLLRDLGARINLETHEEITSFELVRIVEAVGPDVTGVCFDTANVLARGEHPVWAAKRLAPYVHLTHAKDAIIYFVEDGLERHVRPSGQGIVDWGAIIPILGKYAPELNLSIEDQRVLLQIQIFDRHWHSLHPDLTALELAEVVQLAMACERKISSGEILPPEAYDAVPWEDQKIERLQASRDHLKRIVEINKLGNPR